MTIQIGKSLVSRGSASQRMLSSALHEVQASSDASGRVMSLWEGCRRDPRRGYLVPCFIAVRGTAPPRGARPLADPRSGVRLDMCLGVDEFGSGAADYVVLAAIVRPDLPRKMRRRQIRATARQHRCARGW